MDSSITYSIDKYITYISPNSIRKGFQIIITSMSYYYPGQSQNAPTTSPSNLDISCIIDPVAGKGGLYVGNITAATNNELLMSTILCKLVNGIRAMLTSAM
jgi:protein-tyrosine phosphatase